MTNAMVPIEQLHYTGEGQHTPARTDFMAMAERELGAFINAVTELCGPEQARLSAEDWLEELALMNSEAESTGRDWRPVTIAASARLASRLTTAQQHRTPRVEKPANAGHFTAWEQPALFGENTQAAFRSLR